MYIIYSKRSAQKCKLCKTEHYLMTYEVMLFNYSYKNMDIKNINWSNEFKMSQKEFLLTGEFEYLIMFSVYSKCV